MKTDIEIHTQIQKPGQVQVAQAGSALWLACPLSEDKTATVTIFLSAHEALRIGADLSRLGTKMQRIEALEKEEISA